MLPCSQAQGPSNHRGPFLQNLSDLKVIPYKEKDPYLSRDPYAQAPCQGLYIYLLYCFSE